MNDVHKTWIILCLLNLLLPSQSAISKCATGKYYPITNFDDAIEIFEGINSVLQCDTCASDNIGLDLYFPDATAVESYYETKLPVCVPIQKEAPKCPSWCEACKTNTSICLTCPLTKYLLTTSPSYRSQICVSSCSIPETAGNPNKYYLDPFNEDSACYYLGCPKGFQPKAFVEEVDSGGGKVSIAHITPFKCSRCQGYREQERTDNTTTPATTTCIPGILEYYPDFLQQEDEPCSETCNTCTDDKECGSCSSDSPYFLNIAERIYSIPQTRLTTINHPISICTSCEGIWDIKHPDEFHTPKECYYASCPPTPSELNDTETPANTKHYYLTYVLDQEGVVAPLANACTLCNETLQTLSVMILNGDPVQICAATKEAIPECPVFCGTCEGSSCKTCLNDERILKIEPIPQILDNPQDICSKCEDGGYFKDPVKEDSNICYYHHCPEEYYMLTSILHSDITEMTECVKCDQPGELKIVQFGKDVCLRENITNVCDNKTCHCNEDADRCMSCLEDTDIRIFQTTQNNTYLDQNKCTACNESVQFKDPIRSERCFYDSCPIGYIMTLEDRTSETLSICSKCQSGFVSLQIQFGIDKLVCYPDNLSQFCPYYCNSCTEKTTNCASCLPYSYLTFSTKAIDSMVICSQCDKPKYFKDPNDNFQCYYDFCPEGYYKVTDSKEKTLEELNECSPCTAEGETVTEMLGEEICFQAEIFLNTAPSITQNALFVAMLILVASQFLF